MRQIRQLVSKSTDVWREWRSFSSLPFWVFSCFPHDRVFVTLRAEVTPFHYSSAHSNFMFLFYFILFIIIWSECSSCTIYIKQAIFALSAQDLFAFIWFDFHSRVEIWFLFSFEYLNCTRNDHSLEMLPIREKREKTTRKKGEGKLKAHVFLLQIWMRVCADWGFEFVSPRNHIFWKPSESWRCLN